MHRLNRLATLHPVDFSLLITLLMLVFYLLAGILAEIVSTKSVEHNLLEALGRGRLNHPFVASFSVRMGKGCRSHADRSTHCLDGKPWHLGL